jgi:hypothetical protein
MVYHLDADNHVRGLLFKKSGEGVPITVFLGQGFLILLPIQQQLKRRRMSKSIFSFSSLIS